MGKNKLNKIKIKRLKIIKLPAGNVMRFLRKEEMEKKWKFGETYFSKIKFGKIKAWKYHAKTTMNLAVLVGKVKFVFYSQQFKSFKTIIMEEKKYARLTIPPKIWFGFKGLSKSQSLILNISSIIHDPNEVESCSVNELNYNW